MTPEQMRAAAAASVGQAAAAVAEYAGGGRTEPHDNTLLEVSDLKMYFPGHRRSLAQAQGRRHQGR